VVAFNIPFVIDIDQTSQCVFEDIMTQSKSENKIDSIKKIFDEMFGYPLFKQLTKKLKKKHNNNNYNIDISSRQFPSLIMRAIMVYGVLFQKKITSNINHNENNKIKPNIQMQLIIPPNCTQSELEKLLLKGLDTQLMRNEIQQDVANIPLAKLILLTTLFIVECETYRGESCIDCLSKYKVIRKQSVFNEIPPVESRLRQIYDLVLTCDNTLTFNSYNYDDNEFHQLLNNMINEMKDERTNQRILDKAQIFSVLAYSQASVQNNLRNLLRMGNSCHLRPFTQELLSALKTVKKHKKEEMLFLRKARKKNEKITELKENKIMDNNLIIQKSENEKKNVDVNIIQDEKKETENANCLLNEIKNKYLYLCMDDSMFDVSTNDTSQSTEDSFIQQLIQKYDPSLIHKQYSFCYFSFMELCKSVKTSNDLQNKVLFAICTNTIMQDQIYSADFCWMEKPEYLQEIQILTNPCRMLFKPCKFNDIASKNDLKNITDPPKVVYICKLTTMQTLSEKARWLVHYKDNKKEKILKPVSSKWTLINKKNFSLFDLFICDNEFKNDIQGNVLIKWVGMYNGKLDLTLHFEKLMIQYPNIINMFEKSQTTHLNAFKNNENENEISKESKLKLWKKIKQNAMHLLSLKLDEKTIIHDWKEWKIEKVVCWLKVLFTKHEKNLENNDVKRFITVFREEQATGALLQCIKYDQYELHDFKTIMKPISFEVWAVFTIELRNLPEYNK